MVPPEQAFLPKSPDALTEADDEAVAMAIEFQSEVFAGLPHLRDRCAETGAFARCHTHLSNHGSGLAARMEARIRDLEQAVLDLRDGGDGLFSTGGLQDGQGYGAVESPRGRLYHWLKLDDAGLIVDYGIVAPTEWNFHPAGPFVASLLGAKVGKTAIAQRLISWLAALFDPCVPFRVVVAEPGHA
jgi:Ni,Fe-hydrogenase I large subunit